MNYIHQLQRELKAEQEHARSLEAGLVSVIIYLDSAKFDEDPTVQKNDIIRRLRDIQQAAMEDYEKGFSEFKVPVQ